MIHGVFRAITIPLRCPADWRDGIQLAKSTNPPTEETWRQEAILTLYPSLSPLLFPLGLNKLKKKSISVLLFKWFVLSLSCSEFLVCSKISVIDFLMFKTKILSEFVTMSRIDEIIEIENRMEFYFQDLQNDIIFTEEQIRDFHSNWQRLNEIDPPQRPTRKKRLIYSLLCLIIFFLICVIISFQKYVSLQY